MNSVTNNKMMYSPLMLQYQVRIVDVDVYLLLLLEMGSVNVWIFLRFKNRQ